MTTEEKAALLDFCAEKKRFPQWDFKLGIWSVWVQGARWVHAADACTAMRRFRDEFVEFEEAKDGE